MNPADAHVCPECEMAHLPGAPHYMSIPYQRLIFEKFGRLATEEDAIQHCSDRVKRLVTNQREAVA